MKRTIALAGHPNSGKTTVFNKLVGAREKIGNWPGTTIERKEGMFKHGSDQITVIDLPGTYSLSAHSIDEKIAADFLISGKADTVVATIDASHLERNLYLAIQLIELGQNVILDFNMMDVAAEHGIDIDANKFSELLKVPVVKTIALRSNGIDALKNTITSSAGKASEMLNIDYGELEEFINDLKEVIHKSNINVSVPQRAIAIKILESDAEVLCLFKDSEHKKTIDDIRFKAGERFGDTETFIIEKRYAYLRGLVRECVRRHLTFDQRLTISDKIDKVVTHPVLGIPIFMGFMYCLFSMVFTLGEPLVDLINSGFGILAEKVSIFILDCGLPLWSASLISDGIIAGVGSVLSFLPYILLLFLGMSLLEHAGYLARAAFVTDRIMHKIGLHGKSFIPMLLGFGCNIPGIMATRTLESQKDRTLTIMILPLMSCSARLPVYTLFAAALFPHHQGLVVFSLYILGIVLAIGMARIFRGFLFKGETTPLVIELPPYRLPEFRHVFSHMWFVAILFVKKAGTVIFSAVVIMWCLASLPVGVEYASENSIIGIIGKFIAPVFAPAGFGFWQASVSLMAGIVAKEVVVGTLGTLYGAEGVGLANVLRQNFTPLSAYSFMVMTLIYIPCIAAIAVIKQETNWKWAGFTAGYTLVLGWVASVIVYQVGSIFL